MIRKQLDNSCQCFSPYLPLTLGSTINGKAKTISLFLFLLGDSSFCNFIRTGFNYLPPPYAQRRKKPLDVTGMSYHYKPTLNPLHHGL